MEDDVGKDSGILTLELVLSQWKQKTFILQLTK